MRQRNDTGHVQDVLAWPTETDPGRRPFTVGPGEVVEFPELIGGFTEVEGEPGPEVEGLPDGDHVDPAPTTEPAPTTTGRRATKPQGGDAK